MACSIRAWPTWCPAWASFLGLRCLTRARAHDRHGRAGWLSTAAFALGACGIWAMHFIAMLGFTIPGQQIHYNIALTIASMVLAIAVVGAGLFIVGYGDGTWPRLATAGVLVGLGVASMHYMGMAAMSMPDSMSYSPGLFGLSLVIAIVAGTAALWIGTWVKGLAATLGASLVMGVAVNGMHYTGMAALRVTKGMAVMPGTQASGSSASSFVVPLVFGISLAALVLTLVVSLARTEEEIAEDALIEQRLKDAAAREPVARGTPSGPRAAPATLPSPSGYPSAFTKPPARELPRTWQPAGGPGRLPCQPGRGRARERRPAGHPRPRGQRPGHAAAGPLTAGVTPRDHPSGLSPGGETAVPPRGPIGRVRFMDAQLSPGGETHRTPLEEPIGRVRFMDAQRVNLDGFAAPDPSLGLIAMSSPGDPAPGLVITGGRVTELDGRPEAEFDSIDEFIARHGLDLTVAGEAMALDDIALARLMVDPFTPRAEVIRLTAGATPAKLARVLALLAPAELAMAMTKLRARRTPVQPGARHQPAR